MAKADYRLCDVCGEKAFYDARLDYDFEEYPDTGLSNLSTMAVVCRGCGKTHTATVLQAGADPRVTALAEEIDRTWDHLPREKRAWMRLPQAVEALRKELDRRVDSKLREALAYWLRVKDNPGAGITAAIKADELLAAAARDALKET